MTTQTQKPTSQPKPLTIEEEVAKNHVLDAITQS
jgi:hypothetical protein